MSIRRFSRAFAQYTGTHQFPTRFGVYGTIVAYVAMKAEKTLPTPYAPPPPPPPHPPVFLTLPPPPSTDMTPIARAPIPRTSTSTFHPFPLIFRTGHKYGGRLPSCIFHATYPTPPSPPPVFGHGVRLVRGSVSVKKQIGHHKVPRKQRCCGGVGVGVGVGEKGCWCWCWCWC